MTTASALTLDTVDIHTPDNYAKNGYPYEDFKLLRREAPIYWYDRPDIEPFWAFTKQKEMHFISRHPQNFVSSKRLVLAPKSERNDMEDMPADAPKSIIQSDPPEHALHRNMLSPLFTPKALRAFEPRVRELSTEIVDELLETMVDPATGKGECDFVIDIAAKLPLYIICELVGVPRDMSKQMFNWVNETIGSSDPEYQHGASAEESRKKSSQDMQMYLYGMVQSKKQNPGNDITSMFVTEPRGDAMMTDPDILAELGLLMAGGIETTRNATTGGWLALMQHPDQYDQLKANRALIPSAIEEFLRWSTPIIHFGRECVEDIEVSGQLVKKGEAVGMFYASGNRDEDVFENPDVFDIERSPNEHVAFGAFGEHYCLGANLARTQLWTVTTELLNRVERFEQAGDVQRLRNGFVGGIKHLPVKFTVAQ